jgi:hypothetical protein
LKKRRVNATDRGFAQPARRSFFNAGTDPATAPTGPRRTADVNLKALALPVVFPSNPAAAGLFTAAMVKRGSGDQSPADARRERLAASLRSNLRRRKDQTKQRSDTEKTGDRDAAETRSGSNTGPRTGPRTGQDRD